MQFSDAEGHMAWMKKSMRDARTMGPPGRKEISSPPSCDLPLHFTCTHFSSFLLHLASLTVLASCDLSSHAASRDSICTQLLLILHLEPVGNQFASPGIRIHPPQVLDRRSRWGRSTGAAFWGWTPASCKPPWALTSPAPPSWLPLPMLAASAFSAPPLRCTSHSWPLWIHFNFFIRKN